MSADQTSTGEVTVSAEQLDAMHDQLAGLMARIELLEGDLATVRGRLGEPEPEVLLAISAAVAAYLGKRATVRQVRLRRDSSWSSQGRAEHQRSHAFTHGAR